MLAQLGLVLNAMLLAAAVAMTICANVIGESQYSLYVACQLCVLHVGCALHTSDG